MTTDLTEEQLRVYLDSAFSGAFKHATQLGQEARSDPFGLSLSGLGSCTRQAAYRLSRTEPSDSYLAFQGERRAAHIGTWVHEGLLPALSAVLGGDRAGVRYEYPVTLKAGDDEIPGTLDVWWPEIGVVIDLKTGSAYRSYRAQTGGYALSLYQQGEDVRWVVLAYLDKRSPHGIRYDIQAFDKAFAMEVLRRVWEVQGWRKNPDDAPRTESGPGLSFVCDGCPWLSRCWDVPAGQAPQYGDQAVVAPTDEQLAEALEAYDTWRTRAKAADEGKKFWRAVVTGRGRAPSVAGGWRWSWGKSADTPDFEQIKADYLLMGKDLPVRQNSPKFHVKQDSSR